MESFYKLFLLKKDYRKMKLFIALQDASDMTVYIGNVVVDYPYGKKTMYLDFQELQDDVFNVFGKVVINEIEKGIFKLTTDIFLSRQKLVLFYIKNSRVFCLFNYIIQNTKLTPKEFEKKFHYSPSVLYKTLGMLNQNLKALNISISPSIIEGDERMIRHFLVESYWIFFGGIEWPFNVDKQFLTNIMNEFEYLGSQFNNIEKEKLLYWIAIIKLRNDKGHNVTIKPQTSNKSGEIIFNRLFLGDNQTEFVGNEWSFFINITNYFGSDFYVIPEEKNISHNSENRLALEQYFIRKSSEEKWNHSKQKKFIQKLMKIRYYLKMDLIDWYHYLEPEAASTFNKYGSLIEKPVKKLFNQFSDKVSSTYLFELNKASVVIVEPMTIKINSMEIENTKIESLLKGYSAYPLEINNENQPSFDMLITNYLPHSIEQNCTNYTFFYELPLNKDKILEAVDEALQEKIKNRNS